MSIGSAILNVLKTILKIGAATVPEIVSAYSPALGDLLNRVLSGVLNAEAAVPAKGQGSVKQTVASLLLSTQGADIAGIFATAGKPIVNPDLFDQGTAKIQEGIVDLLNATGQMAKPPAPAK